MVALKAPLNARPIGVLAVETIAASLMSVHSQKVTPRAFLNSYIASAGNPAIVQYPYWFHRSACQFIQSRNDRGERYDPA